MKETYDFSNCLGEYHLFAGQFAEKEVDIDLSQAKNTVKGITYRIPSLLSLNDGSNTVLSVLDTSESGGDFGRIQNVMRRSTDGGKSFDDMQLLLSLPVSKAPQKRNEYKSAFAIDPVLVRCKNGDVLIIVDMYPECKGLMYRPWLEKKNSFVEIDGKSCLTLHTAKTKVGKTGLRGRDKVYTVRENGWVYSPSGKKTGYYLPQNHSAEYAFETVGDLYYAVGTPDYIDCCPPLIPKEDEGADIYCGNVYLSHGKTKFNETAPEKAKKRVVSPEGEGELYSKYKCVEGTPAPLSATVKSYLWVLRSKDNGKTWSQPVAVSGRLMKKNEVFLGTGPGVAVCLECQKDESKNGRILVPVYNTKETAVIYSDDNGYTWKRSACSENIDETQLVELSDGTLLCFGRQKKLGKTPVSISIDSGETWKRVKSTDLYSVKCQKSLIRVPKESYVDGMDKEHDYVIASHPTGSGGQNSSRSVGAVTLGMVEDDKSITWIRQRKLRADAVHSKNEFFYAYSCLTALENKNLGLMYEALPSGFAVYEEFSMQWLMDGCESF